MKRIVLFVLMLVSVAAISQPANYLNIRSRYNLIAVKNDSGFHVPGYSTIPNYRGGVWSGAGNIGVDTVNHKFYFYSGGAWREAGSTNYADSLRRSGLTVQMRKGGVWTNQFDLPDTSWKRFGVANEDTIATANRRFNSNNRSLLFDSTSMKIIGYRGYGGSGGASLHVEAKGSHHGVGIYAYNTSTFSSGYNVAVYGANLGSSGVARYGGMFTSANTNGTGDFGVYASAGGGSYAGNHKAVYALSNNGAGTNYGVDAIADGATTNNYGLKSLAYNATNNYGLHSTAQYGTTTVAGYFKANFGTNNYAIVTDGGSFGHGTTSPTAFTHIIQPSATGTSSGNGVAAVSPLTLTGGNGSDADAGQSNKSGGNAGDLSIITGNGGAASGTNGNGGYGGDINMTAGDGGYGTTNGGQAGNVEIQGGTGGIGTNGGAAGYAALKGGSAGAAGNAAGGDVFLIGGVPQGSGREGGIFLGVSPSWTVRGNVTIGSATYGTHKLTVNSSGNGFKLADGTQGAGKVLTSDANGGASWQTPAGGGGLTIGTTTIGNSVSGSVLYDSSGILSRNDNFYWNRTDKKLGIGTNSPLVKADINGSTVYRNMNVSMILRGNVTASALVFEPTDASAGSSIESINGELAFYTKSSSGNFSNANTRLTIKSTGGIIINDNGEDADTRIEGDTDPNLLFVDASADKVGIGTSSPHSKLQVAGSFSTQYTTTATGITLDATHCIVNVTATGQTITLPAASGITGRQYTIKLTASGSCTVDGNASETIDGSATYSLSAQYKYVTVVSDGTNWIITANN